MEKHSPQSRNLTDNGLTPQQEAFCQEYVINHNATEAAIKAGYSAKAARAVSSRLLTKANVKAYVNALHEKVAERTGIDAAKVLEQYIKIAFGSIYDIIDPNTGELKPGADGSLIQSMTVKVRDTGTERSVKTVSKDKALEVLAKFTGLVKDDPQVNLKLDPELIESLQRVLKHEPEHR